jgi:hypothetical protein
MCVLLIAVVRAPIILLSRPPIIAFIAVARAPIIPLSRPPILVCPNMYSNMYVRHHYHHLCMYIGFVSEK